MNDLWSTIAALGFAGAIGAGIFFGIVKFMFNSQSNSVFSLEDLVETEAEVLTPIPVNGLGEIAYVINGVRYTLSARSLEGNSIKRGSTVIVREIASNAAVVQQKLTLDDIELTDEEHEVEENQKPRSNA
jgi:membrane-bound ClpP family serine protease